MAKNYLDKTGLSHFWQKIKTYVDNKTVSASVDLNLLYPIGRGFIDFTDTDYSNWLGFTWERELVGMFPIGYNPDDTDFNTIGKTGGEKTHKLTLTEIPSHRHPNVVTNVTSSRANTWDINKTAASVTSVSRTISNSGSSGGGQAHNNLPPFQVVAYWKRVA